MCPNYTAQEGEPYEGDARGEPKPPTPGAPGHEAGDPTQPKPAEGQPEPTPTFSFGEPPPAPEGQAWDPVALKSFDIAIQDLGVGSDEAKWVLERYASWREPQNEHEYNAAMAAAESALRKEFGPLYEEKMAGAVAVAKGLSPELLAELDRSGMGNDVELIKRFVAIAERMGSAQDQINKILGDPSSAYRNPRHPEHERAVKDLQKLYANVYGSRPVS